MTVGEKVAGVPRWRHRIQLPGGVVTPGSQDTLAQLPTLGVPDNLSGLTVLDVGCSDGFYSFESEKRGAARVLAVDNYSSVYIDNPSGFNVAHESLQSRVEFLKSDLFDLDAQQIGQFDVVLFLGVLYHLRHPLLALERLATLCRRQLIVETVIAAIPAGRRTQLAAALSGYEPPQHWMQFFPSEEVNHDPTTFWAPSFACAEAMLRSCGFCGVKTVSSTSNRGVFHGFSPAEGDDVERLIERVGPSLVAQAATEVLGRQIDAGSLAGALRAASIPDFGRIRQAAAELKAKDWHQRGRWQDSQ